MEVGAYGQERALHLTRRIKPPTFPGGAPVSDETALADVLEFLLAGRPERLTEMALAQMTPEQRAVVAQVSETIAALSVGLSPVEPSPGLKERIVATLRQRRAAAPRRALLVCDMIRDHLTPGRALEIPRARAIVDALVGRIAEARQSGVPVVYVLDRHEPDDPELAAWGVHAVEGTEGAEVWPALAPEPGDHVVTKPSYSGFHGTRLERVLDDLAVDTLVLAGCATEVQLMSTATDALQRGFEVELPADAQAGNSEAAEAVILAVLGLLVPYAPARRDRLARLRERA